jgi:2-amino-4-hydroxy-6-hydroxymethyldihydropteridine diphosphokinase
MPVTEIVAYIGLGSNLQDPRSQVSRGLQALEHLPRTRCTARSSLYSSPPLGPPDQPEYVNAVACLATGLAAPELLAALLAVEQTHGRVRDGTRWGPRTLDLDILTYGDACIDSPELRIPHPGIPERAFVLYPLAEIAPADLEIQGLGLLADSLRRCPRGELKRLGGDA